jgi:predicted phosphodiesterase
MMRRRLAFLLSVIALAVMHNGTVPARAVTAPQPGTKIAFLGDQALNGRNRRAERVLDLVASEDAHALVILGDFDYESNPNKWGAELEEALPKPFPVFAVAGNHDIEDFSKWPDYKRRIEERLKTIPGAHCQGGPLLGEQYTCDFRGVRLILVSPGLLYRGKPADGETQEISQRDAGTYIRDRLAESDHLFSICGWHYNQRALQTGEKGNQAGWDVYEECRKGGGIVATAHEHSYARTHLMSDLRQQTILDTSDTLAVRPGQTFVFHSGLGGAELRDQDRYDPWWAAVWNSETGAAHGALFCTFHVPTGWKNRAECYFKDIEGNDDIDNFTIIAETARRARLCRHTGQPPQGACPR